MFSQKNRDLKSENIDNCKHVGECHVCYDEEQGSIDALNTFNRFVILAKVDKSKNECNYLNFK